VTTSLIVAKKFDRRHDNVLQGIETLECSPDFNLLNFQEISYTDDKNRTYKAYNMTRDGFVFLVMGFTGPKAAKFKEAFINEFNPKLPCSPWMPPDYRRFFHSREVWQEAQECA